MKVNLTSSQNISPQAFYKRRIIMIDFTNELGNIYSIEDLPLLSGKERPKNKEELFDIDYDCRVLIWDGQSVEYKAYPLLTSLDGNVWRLEKHVSSPAYAAILHDVTIKRYDSCIGSSHNGVLFKNFIGAHRAVEDPHAQEIKADFNFNRTHPTPSNGLPIIISNDGWHNYWHVHAQSLLALFSIVTWDNIENTSVVCGHLNNWHREILELFGIHSKNILELKSEYNYYEKIIYPSAVDPRAFINIDPRLKDVFAHMKRNTMSKFPALFEKELPKLIYVSRGDAQHRKIKDEEGVIRALENIGFSVVTPGTLSYPEQVAFFSNAQVIVGLHGAGLTNIGYAPEGALLIELFDRNYMNYVYYVTSRICNLKYECILSKGELIDERLQLDLNPLLVMQLVLSFMEIHGCTP